MSVNSNSGQMFMTLIFILYTILIQCKCFLQVQNEKYKVTSCKYQVKHLNDIFKKLNKLPIISCEYGHN